MLTAHLDIFLCKYLSVMFLFFFSTDFRSSLYILEMSLTGCVCVCVCVCVAVLLHMHVFNSIGCLLLHVVF